MQTLVEDFLQYLRHERGQAEHTQRTYAALLGKFIAWADRQGLTDWKQVKLRHLMAFLQHERERGLANEPKDSPRRLSSESVYLEICALRAFYRFAENERLLPVNVAENLSLPRRWKRLPKALTSEEIDRLLARSCGPSPLANSFRRFPSGSSVSTSRHSIATERRDSFLAARRATRQTQSPLRTARVQIALEARRQPAVGAPLAATWPRGGNGSP